MLLNDVEGLIEPQILPMLTRIVNFFHSSTFEFDFGFLLFHFVVYMYVYNTCLRVFVGLALVNAEFLRKMSILYNTPPQQ